MSQIQPLSTLAPVSMESSAYPMQYASPSRNVKLSSCEKPCAKPQKSCEKKCETPCGNGHGYDMTYGWGWFGALVLWFLIFLVIFWLIFYSLKPSFVLQSGTNQVDTAKVLLAAVIAALILIIIIWLIKWAISFAY